MKKFFKRTWILIFAILFATATVVWAVYGTKSSGPITTSQGVITSGPVWVSSVSIAADLGDASGTTCSASFYDSGTTYYSLTEKWRIVAKAGEGSVSHSFPIPLSFNSGVYVKIDSGATVAFTYLTGKQ